MIDKDIKNAFIYAKATLGLPLTAKERAMFLLYIASDEEAMEFLNREKEKIV